MGLESTIPLRPDLEILDSALVIANTALVPPYMALSQIVSLDEKYDLARPTFTTTTRLTSV